MRLWGSIAVLALAASCAHAATPPDPTALLKQVYENYRSSSSEASVAMTVHRPDWERHMEMKSWTRGQDDALVRFVSPAKDAGNATLKLENDTWVFNPRLNQVIKLPASMMTQSWMGSDFSYNDLSKSEDIVTQYTHRLVSSESSAGHAIYTIEAVPKPGAPVVWGKVTLRVRDDLVLTEETFFDQDMKPVRHMITERIGTLGGRVYPVAMAMHPMDSPGQWTRIETAAAEFNTPQPNYLFTLSNLQNPRP